MSNGWTEFCGQPPAYEIRREEKGLARVLLYEDAQPLPGGEGRWRARARWIVTADTGFLASRVQADPGAWLFAARARAVAEAAQAARRARNAALQATDYLAMRDYPLDEGRLAELSRYRQALRDLPQAPGFPEGHEWPAPPAWMGGTPHEA